MRITKCDICKKIINPSAEVLQLAYNDKKMFDSFELCFSCGKPIIKILKEKGLLKVEDKETAREK